MVLSQETLGRRYDVLAPEHYGCESGPLARGHAFTLADEAAKAIELIDDTGDPNIRVVGSPTEDGSRWMSRRPDRAASAAWRSPASAFHLLPQLGDTGIAAYQEIAGVRGVSVRELSRAAVRRRRRLRRVSSEPGAWDALRPSVQDALMRWAPKEPLDFHALMTEPTLASTYRILPFPMLLLRRDRAPSPTRIIVECFQDLLPVSGTHVVDGAGRIGPLTPHRKSPG